MVFMKRCEAEVLLGFKAARHQASGSLQFAVGRKSDPFVAQRSNLSQVTMLKKGGNTA
jgi:hypothetical protein